MEIKKIRIKKTIIQELNLIYNWLNSLKNLQGQSCASQRGSRGNRKDLGFIGFTPNLNHHLLQQMKWFSVTAVIIISLWRSWRLIVRDVINSFTARSLAPAMENIVLLNSVRIKFIAYHGVSIAYLGYPRTRSDNQERIPVSVRNVMKDDLFKPSIFIN